MKKFLGCFLCVLLLGFGASPAGASLLVIDLDPPNTGAYWTGDDFNDGYANNLINASEATEEGWLETGLLNNTVGIELYDRWPAGSGYGFDDEDTAINIDTSAYLDWEYAIVKWNGFWAAYWDNDSSDILSHPAEFAADKGLSLIHI